MAEITIVILLVVVTTLVWYILRNTNDKINSYMSFRESMDLVELPVVTFYQGDKKLNFLLDTGSNNNIINSSVLKDIKYSKTKKESSITGIGGKINRTKYVSINFSYKNVNYTANFQSTDMDAAFNSIKQETGVTIHGIIGSLFFKEFEYILDFEKLIAYSKKK